MRRANPIPSWSHDVDFVIADATTRSEATESMDRSARRQWNAETAPRWLAWNARPTPSRARAIQAVRLRVGGDARALELPVALPELSRLRFLSMPLPFAAKLRADALPTSIEALDFDESTGGIGSIPTDLVLPKVRSVSAVTGELRFARASLPRLEMVELRLGTSGKMLEVLGSYRRLRDVALHPVHDLEALEPLAELRLSALGITGGRLQTLEGIEAFGSLRTLRLESLSKLRDISALRSLERLTSLDIQYCGALEDLSAMLELPRLHSLSITSCHRIRLAEVAGPLRSRKWKELAITGKRHLYESDGEWILSTR